MRIKKLKTVTRCNMCPYCVKYSDGSKECGYSKEAFIQIKDGKKIDKKCELPRHKKYKQYRIVILEYCVWCPYYKLGYIDYNTGYIENICKKEKYINFDWYSRIPSFCKLKDYVEI